MIEVIGRPLKQWELGRKIRILADEPFTEVHFAQTGDAEALVVEPKEENGVIIADIPNILLQSHRKLFVWLVLSTDDSEENVEMAGFYIETKPKPSDYVYTETEIKNYEALEKRIKAIETTGGGGAVDYDVLENTPIKNVTSDQENMIALRDLESGVYKLSGSFTPYHNSNIYVSFSNNQLVNVVTKQAGTHIQIFYPVNNCVQFVSIMVDENSEDGYVYTKNYVYLNDLTTKDYVDSLFGSYITDVAELIGGIEE